MRGGTLLQLLLRALSLAALGVVFSIGTASAHQGHHHEAPAGGAIAATVATFVHGSEVAAQAPCSGDAAGCLDGDCCCAVACHAALAAPPAGPAVDADRPGLRLIDRAEPLAGLAGDRTERPPKAI